jgi:hypothetical protein
MKRQKSIKAGTFRLVENWTVSRVNHHTGEVLETEKKTNLIVNAGLEYVAKLINGEHTTYFRAIAIGTGITGAANENVTLEAEYTRALATLSYEANYIAKFTYTFTFGSGVAEDITEAGILDNSVAGGNLLARTTFAVKSVSADVDLIVTVQITCARV